MESAHPLAGAGRSAVRRREILGGGLLRLVLLCAVVALCAPAIAQPMPIEARGDYAHPASGMIMPLTVGAFLRVGVYRYDAEALDVSANYHLDAPSGRVLASVYAYPMPGGSIADAAARRDACQREFQLRQRELTSVRAGARLLAERDVLPPKGYEGVPGHLAAYVFQAMIGGQPRMLHSELHVFCFVGRSWIIKYRFTGPDSPQTLQAIAAFVAALPWTVQPMR